MATIQEYIADPDLAFIDAASDPVFREFMQAGDFEWFTVSRGGIRRLVRALARSSVGVVLQRMLARLRQEGPDLEHWICSPDYFDLCRKLREMALGRLMAELYEFLSKKWVEKAVGYGHGIAIAIGGHVEEFYGIFVVVGLANSDLVKRCNCKESAAIPKTF